MRSYVNDVMFGKTTKLKLVGKGRKARSVSIPGNCAKILRDYIVGARGLDICGERDKLRHVFPTQTHEKMSISCVEEVVKKYVAIAKKAHPSLFRQNRYSPHSFRHSIAVHMLECGESIAVIRAFLGHASIATTMIYASVTPEIANKYLKDRDIGIETLKDATSKKEQSGLLSFLQKSKLD
ncbi:tyrosine-type recombinase/integrase [Paenibacillus sp. p3-SID867]|uniref:tyrosine-type recombinase/integrase n=1 Tax=Paenibacillus sp. p3-SID867 TaxID=2916363 RepID=UPI0021A783FD|nr:tyrosine-type recombinase/integrase [Paenibacillus sp. p3-SID867]MCT1402834.1 tyrosine-type recombinase/integrase [Paenibacillus sp. p3-SID867]